MAFDKEFYAQMQRRREEIKRDEYLTQRRKGAKVRVLNIQFWNFILQYSYTQKSTLPLCDSARRQMLQVGKAAQRTGSSA